MSDATRSLKDIIETLSSADAPAGIDLNIKLERGDSPLGLVCAGGSKDYITLMLQHGADPNYIVDGGMHPLVSAMCYFVGRDDAREIVKIARAMLDAGLDVNAVQGRSLLMEAAYYDLPDLCLFLLEHGADGHFENSEGETALIVAQSAQSQDALMALCEFLGEDIANWASATRLSIDGLFEYFTDPEPGVNSRDGLQHTPLHIAAELGAWHLIADLVDLGADLEARNHRGETPVFKVLNSDIDTDSARDTLSELVVFGADLATQNDEGQTVLDAARARPGMGELASYLEGTGAPSAQ